MKGGSTEVVNYYALACILILGIITVGWLISDHDSVKTATMEGLSSVVASESITP